MSRESSAHCPSCGAEPYEVFAELPDMPVHVGVLWESADAARASALGDVALAFCPSCGFVNQVGSPERPLEVSCKECGMAITLKEKKKKRR